VLLVPVFLFVGVEFYMQWKKGCMKGDFRTNPQLDGPGELPFLYRSEPIQRVFYFIIHEINRFVTFKVVGKDSAEKSCG